MNSFDTMNRSVKKFETTTAPATVAEAPATYDTAVEQNFTPMADAPANTVAAVVPSAAKERVTVKNALDSVWDDAPFTSVDVDDAVMLGFASEYNPSINTVGCIADRRMLLEYMVAMERKYHVTMSFPAYGVDPIAFDEAVERDLPEGNPPIISIKLPESEGTAAPKTDDDGNSVGGGGPRTELYEKIEVDDILYLSCVSECLDQQYLHKVITEVTESLYMHGQYMYTLVGPRPLVSDSTPEEYGRFPLIETLKLNSYELSVLLAYVNKMDGVEVVHGVFDGRSAILFRKV